MFNYSSSYDECLSLYDIKTSRSCCCKSDF